MKELESELGSDGLALSMKRFKEAQQDAEARASSSAMQLVESEARVRELVGDAARDRALVEAAEKAAQKAAEEVEWLRQEVKSERGRSVSVVGPGAN